MQLRQQNMKRSALMALAGLASSSMLSAQATFLGPIAGQQWGTAANWSTASVPNAADAVAVLAGNGGVGNVAITNSGLGYSAAPAVTFSGGTGPGGTSATAILSNRVAVFNVTNGGTGYTSAPTVTISGGGATVPALAAAQIDAATGKVTAVTVSYGGYGYTSAPTVSLSGGGGSGAEVVAHIAPGVVGVNLTAAGTYSAAPSVAFAAPPTGTNAVGTTAIDAGAVTSVALTTAGAGYVVPPAVTFGAPPSGGTRAQGYAVITDGAVTSVVLTHAGSGYTTAPTVTFSAPVVTATGSTSINPVPWIDDIGGTYPYTVGTLQFTFGGGGSIGRAETSTDLLSLARTAGTTATATATISSGQLVGVSMDNMGSGYTSDPIVLIVGGGGRGAKVYPVIFGGVVEELVIEDPGSGYTSAPTIVIQPPDVPAIDVTATGGNLFIYGSLAGTQGFAKTGPGGITFRFNPHDNPISGPIYLNAGTLGIQSDGSLGAAGNDIIIGSGARLLAQPSTNAVISLNPGRSILLASGTNAGEIQNASPHTGTLIVQGPITGPGALTKSQSGVVVLEGANDYVGATTVSAGLLVADRPASLPGYREPQDLALPARINVANTAALTLRMGSAGKWDAAEFDVFLNNLGTGINAGGFIGIDTTGATGTVSIDGLLTGTVTAPTYGFAKSGPGTLELTGVNAYGGGTRIYEGTLVLGAGAAIPATALAFPGTSATLDLGGSSRSFSTITEVDAATTTLTNGSVSLASNITFGGNNGTTVDLSGLTAFTFAATEIKLESTNGATQTFNTTRFAAGTNTIGASGRFLVGGGTSNANGPHLSTALLGASNLINTGHFQIGGFNTAGTVSFLPGLTNPSITVRAADGIARSPKVTLGETSSGVRSGAGTINATGGSIDILVNEFLVNRMIAASNNPAAATLVMPAGTIDATSMVVNDKVNSGTPTMPTTITQSGGVVKASSVIFGRSITGASAAGTPLHQISYTLSGGEFRPGSLTAGPGPFNPASFRTLSLAGGTLATYDASSSLAITGIDVGGGALRVSAAASTTSTIDAPAGQSITLGANTELVAVDASAVVTKSGSGNLALEGLSTGFAGTLKLSAGTLSTGAAAAIVDTNAGALVWENATIAVDLDPVNPLADKLILAGALTKGTGSLRAFDLKGVGAETTYTLITFASTDMVAGDFSAVNVPAGLNAVFAVTANSVTLTLSSGPVLTPIQQWRQTNFGSPDNTGIGADDQDPDGDGRNNLLEYATNTSPVAAQASNVIVDLHEGKLRLSFNRVADPSLTYRVLVSTNLANPWSSATELFSSTGGANTAGLVQVLDSVPMTGNRFMRLEVSY